METWYSADPNNLRFAVEWCSMGSQRHSLHEASEIQKTASSLEPKTQKLHCPPVHHILPHPLRNHPIKQKKHFSISELKIHFLDCELNLFWDVIMKRLDSQIWSWMSSLFLLCWGCGCHPMWAGTWWMSPALQQPHCHLHLSEERAHHMQPTDLSTYYHQPPGCRSPNPNGYLRSFRK